MEIREYRGARDLVAALVTTDTTETYECGEYFPVAGLQNIAKATESDSATKYYDNAPAIVIDSVGADTVTLTVSVLDLETYAKLLGAQYNTDTGTLIEGEANAPYVAIGYITGLVGTRGERYVSRLKGKFAIPEEEIKTADDSTDSSNLQLVYKGINTTHRFTTTGKTAKAVVADTANEKVDFTKFFTKVTTPDNIPVKSVGA